MFTWLSGLLRLRPIPRDERASDRAVVLTLFGRFTDEALTGLPSLLMPTIQARLGLSLVQVGWLFQLLELVAAVVEPIVGALIDTWRRRPLLAIGAAGLGLAIVVIGLAPDVGWLTVGFVLIGLTSGALAQTSDVVLIEAHPGAVERISTRSTFLDTIGALLGPVAVAVWFRFGWDWRWLLVGAGACALVYALLLAATPVPPGPGMHDAGWAGIVARVREVCRHREARRWLAFMLASNPMEAAWLFLPVWLAATIGASQQAIALFVAAGLVVDLVALTLLDRWLQRLDAITILRRCLLGLLVLVPAWLWVPGMTAKVVLLIPVTGLIAPLWPLSQARALASVPGAAGTITGITAVFWLLPTALAVGWIGEHLGLTTALLVALGASLTGMLLALHGLRASDESEQMA